MHVFWRDTHSRNASENVKEKDYFIDAGDGKAI
jgi:hypothetical protein